MLYSRLLSIAPAVPCTIPARPCVQLSLQPSVVTITSTDNDFTTSSQYRRRHLLDALSTSAADSAAANRTSTSGSSTSGGSNSSGSSNGSSGNSGSGPAVASLGVSTTAFTASGSSEGGGVDIRLALLLQPNAQVRAWGSGSVWWRRLRACLRRQAVDSLLTRPRRGRGAGLRIHPATRVRLRDTYARSHAHTRILPNVPTPATAAR